MDKKYLMSFFKAPITNHRPCGTVSLFWLYQYMRSPEARPETDELRAIARKAGMTPEAVKEQQRKFKGERLDWVTPSGTFAYANDNSIIEHSHVLCLDLDDICPLSEIKLEGGDAVDELKNQLIDDPQFNTLMAFRSPRGNGVKWFIEIDLTRCDHRVWFAGVRNFLMAMYHLTDEQVDKHCGNPSRACYLTHDPDVYLRTDLIENFCI
ncbi:MAG: hypothetical protein K6A94_06345 [Bacteroidales bacterium]|nr:hypothetical protein [Bacteroidales bacterium]